MFLIFVYNCLRMHDNNLNIPQVDNNFSEKLMIAL